MITREDYINAGVFAEKLHRSELPSVARWNVRLKKVVDRQEEILDIIPDGKNFKATVENNRLVSMLCRTVLTVEDVIDINNSDGIIFTNWENFRYGFIPTE